MRICIALIAWASVGSAGLAGWKDDIGYLSLQARLGSGTPTGFGVPVTQVEASVSGCYLPDPSNSQFLGKTIVDMIGGGGVSSHATTVALNYYGLTASVAPAIDLIHGYDATSWLDSAFLCVGQRKPPVVETQRTQNHSWIGELSGSSTIDALRRVDLMAERDGVVVAAGVNNGAASAMPKLVGSAYNVMAVGCTSGNSSYGPTLIDVAGRVKPDLVVPHTATSWATPVVAGSAAILIEAADADPALDALTRSDKALLIKALLMGGATKSEFVNWRRGFATPCVDGTVPLDYRYGAGELNIDNSHRILTSGQQEAGLTTTVATTGWDFDTIAAGPGRYYFVDVPLYSCAETLSVLVTWYRHVDIGNGLPAPLTPSLADINLYMYQANGFSVGALLDQSISALDNVEHVFLRGLLPGRYVFELTSNATWNFAVAWDTTLAPTVQADFDGDGDVDMTDFSAIEACFNGPNRPPATSNCEGPDLDGDNDVDLTDFGVFQACFNGPNRPPAPGCP
ncbi:MAG: hypothetical protein JXA69_07825 [Phycisphaerae bacterium]|nr:hypothetical protein [Phycisphaerae bacterium]